LRALVASGLVDDETGLLLDQCGVFGNNIANKARTGRALMGLYMGYPKEWRSLRHTIRLG